MVVNMMIVHILRMYNSKHPHTWDESLPYVQHNYNRAMHSSIGHNPFQACLGFHPLDPIDIALPIAYTQEESTHTKIEVDKATNDFWNEFNTYASNSMTSCRKSTPSIRSDMTNNGFHTSFGLVIKFGYICRKNAL